MESTKEIKSLIDMWQKSALNLEKLIVSVIRNELNQLGGEVNFYGEVAINPRCNGELELVESLYVSPGGYIYVCSPFAEYHLDSLPTHIIVDIYDYFQSLLTKK